MMPKAWLTTAYWTTLFLSHVSASLYRVQPFVDGAGYMLGLILTHGPHIFWANFVGVEYLETATVS